MDKILFAMRYVRLAYNLTLKVERNINILDNKSYLLFKTFTNETQLNVIMDYSKVKNIHTHKTLCMELDRIIFFSYKFNQDKERGLDNNVIAKLNRCLSKDSNMDIVTSDFKIDDDFLKFKLVQYNSKVINLTRYGRYILHYHA